MAQKKTFKQLSETTRNMVRALMEDVALHDKAAGFSKKDISDTLGVKEGSLAAIEANITRRT